MDEPLIAMDKPVMGRPTSYDPAMCEAVVDAGAEGKTLAEMAAAIGVDRSTLADWREKHPDFSRAVNVGLDLAQAWWERQGRLATFGAIEGFNATSYIFQMKNRFREDWRDRHEMEHSGGVRMERVEVAFVGSDGGDE